MSFKYKYEYNDKSTNRNRLDWYFERCGGGWIDDRDHWWVVHCHKPKLIVVKYFDKQYQNCEVCNELPPQRFLQELKLDYVRRKYELEN